MFNNLKENLFMLVMTKTHPPLRKEKYCQGTDFY